MIDEFHNLEPYGLTQTQKDELQLRELKELTRRHRLACPEYDRYLKVTGYDEERVCRREDIPFFPVRMFKEYDLLSVPRSEVFKTMTSSGTTGQAVSRIFVDKETAALQQKVMLRILGDYWGKKRLPMLIIDSPAVIKDRTMFSARGAAILGLTAAAREMVYALDTDMRLDRAVVNAFLEKNGGAPFIIFGFTFLVWQHLYQEMAGSDETFDLSQAWLMTGGGWKQLISERVTGEEFKERLGAKFGIKHFLDHYGMVEQTGGIYAECEYGHLHASIYSDIIPRRYRDLTPCDIGEPGIIQAVSVLPHSYPGHSLLTEDEGVILGEDDCPCGRKGRYIKILGRLKNAELRGCSDTYAAGLAGKIQMPAPREEDTSRNDWSKLTFLVGSPEILEGMKDIPALPTWSDRAIAFLSALSSGLMKLPGVRAHVDVMSYAYWLRKASLERARQEHPGYKERMGRGVTFHVAPSNVPVNFAVSMTSAFLAGNACVIRVSDKPFDAVSMICSVMNSLLSGEFADLAGYFAIVRYPHDAEITAGLSAMCDVRIIWGGDRTIAEIRRAPLPPRSIEMCFADRYSLAVIDTGQYLAAAEDNAKRQEIAKGFYTDTWYSDQNACSSPRIVVWMGGSKEECTRAKELFWDAVSGPVRDDYDLQPLQTVDKLSALASLAMSGDGDGARLIKISDMALVRVETDALTPALMDHREAGGYFYEYHASDMEELLPVLGKRCQTIALYGLDKREMQSFLISHGVRGGDRVVDMGQTMGLEFIWDGFVMTDAMSRLVYIYDEAI